MPPSNIADIAYKTALEALAAAVPGPWIDISNLAVLDWTNAANTVAYRIVGDRVEMRGFVFASAGTKSVDNATVLQWPTDPEVMPAGLGSFQAGVFSNDSGTSNFGCLLGITNKIAIDHFGSTGTPIVGDLIYFDGLSWSVTP